MKRIADVLTVLAALIVLGGYDLLRLLTGFLWQADNGKPGILARFINATAGTGGNTVVGTEGATWKALAYAGRRLVTSHREFYGVGALRGAGGADALSPAQALNSPRIAFWMMPNR